MCWIQIDLNPPGGRGAPPPPPRDVNVLIYIFALVPGFGWRTRLGGINDANVSFSSFLGTVNVFIYIPFLAVFATQPTYYRTGI